MACEGSEGLNCQKLFAVNNIIAKPELQFRWQGQRKNYGSTNFILVHFAVVVSKTVGVFWHLSIVWMANLI